MHNIRWLILCQADLRGNKAASLSGEAEVRQLGYVMIAEVGALPAAGLGERMDHSRSRAPC
jgi:hypothetical protein